MRTYKQTILAALVAVGIGFGFSPSADAAALDDAKAQITGANTPTTVELHRGHHPGHQPPRFEDKRRHDPPPHYRHHDRGFDKKIEKERRENERIRKENRKRQEIEKRKMDRDRRWDDHRRPGPPHPPPHPPKHHR